MVDDCGEDLGQFAREGEKNFGDPSRSCSPKQTMKQEDQLRYMKSEISEVKEENERLKTVLSQITKDYNSLHVNFFDIIRQEQAKKLIEPSPSEYDVEETELVSLSLGSSCGHKKDEKTASEWIKRKEEDQIKDALSLGLEAKFEEPSNATSDRPLNLSPEVSFDELKEEKAVVEACPPSNVLKNFRDDEVSPHVHAKRARVSVRARCEAPTMNDGCHWRKYGQKIAKGNPCPRAYYRCTIAAGCPVRKQVQRCAEDMSILITTYEGIHNHPLPISATNMASTTSAAASMLTSGSTSSSALRGLNFALPNHYLKSNHFYLQNSTPSSSNPLHPTITLDLTTQPPSSSSSTSQLNKLSPNFISNTRYSPSTSRSLCSYSLKSSATPTMWSSGYLNYGAQQSFNNNGKVQIQTTSATSSSTQLHPLTDTIAKAITSDPSFQTMLAAAITSYVEAGRDGERSAAAGGNGSGCGSSYMTGSNSLSLGGYHGNMALLLQSMGFCGGNSAASPVENREHNV